jgi:ribosome biogenesis GTPase / thiamine phosphate phosphatase
MQTQNTDKTHIGTVINKSKGRYTISHHGSSTLCSLSPKLRKHFQFEDNQELKTAQAVGINQKNMDPVAIGDRVTFSSTDAGYGTIEQVAARRNYLSRRAAKPMPSAHAFEQVIAANIDQIIPIFAVAEPAPKWHMLDRYLVAAESHQIPSVIVIAKVDLVKDGRAETNLLEVVECYRKIGYPVILTSIKSQQGLDQLRMVLVDQSSILVGKSGVGKSSLLNVLEPGLGLRVQAVNASTGKGRHTTSHLEMFPLAMGGMIIDTPGTREFGVWGVEPEEIADCFPEMRPLLGLCRFGLSCQHDEEPGCTIREAVMRNEISPYRYRSYLRLKADL